MRGVNKSHPRETVHLTVDNTCGPVERLRPLAFVAFSLRLSVGSGAADWLVSCFSITAAVPQLPRLHVGEYYDALTLTFVEPQRLTRSRCHSSRRWAVGPAVFSRPATPLGPRCAHNAINVVLGPVRSPFVRPEGSLAILHSQDDSARGQRGIR